MFSLVSRSELWEDHFRDCYLQTKPSLDVGLGSLSCWNAQQATSSISIPLQSGAKKEGRDEHFQKTFEPKLNIYSLQL